MFAAFILFLGPVAAHAQQWEMAVRNTGGGGYFKAYSAVSACESDQDEGDDCVVAFPECGPSGVRVAISMFAANSITDPDYGDKVRVYGMNGDNVGDPICAGYVR